MKNAIHFVGFRGDEYHRAIKIFGKPDFFHRVWDFRAKEEAVPGDIVIFANGEREDKMRDFTFDDSAVM